MKIRNFTDLLAWQKSYKLVLEIYKATQNFPKSEIYGLTNQLRRAAVSITSNIAEGFGRFSKKEKTKFYYIAAGSISEVQNQLILSKDLSFLPLTAFESLTNLSIESYKLVNGLIKSNKLP